MAVEHIAIIWLVAYIIGFTLFSMKYRVLGAMLITANSFFSYSLVDSPVGMGIILISFVFLFVVINQEIIQKWNTDHSPWGEY